MPSLNDQPLAQILSAEFLMSLSDSISQLSQFKCDSTGQRLRGAYASFLLDFCLTLSFSPFDFALYPFALINLSHEYYK